MISAGGKAVLENQALRNQPLSASTAKRPTQVDGNTVMGHAFAPEAKRNQSCQ
jgi:hypothetical protein